MYCLRPVKKFSKKHCNIFFSILLDTHDIRVNLKVIKSTLFKRVLTDVSAMAYLLQGTRLDTVKKFVNSVYVPECVHVHVPHVIARDGTRVIKQKVSNIWKSTSSPTSYGIPGWPDLLLIQQPCMSFQWMIGLVEVSRYRKVIPPVYDISAVLSKVVHQPVPSLPNVHCRRTFGAQQEINYVVRDRCKKNVPCC